MLGAWWSHCVNRYRGLNECKSICSADSEHVNAGKWTVYCDCNVLFLLLHYAATCVARRSNITYTLLNEAHWGQ